MEEKTKKKEKKRSILARILNFLFIRFFKITIPLILIAGLVAGGYFYLNRVNYFNSHRTTTVNTSTLEKMIGISELSTISYYYNGFTKKIVDGKEKYVVAYEGNVKAGYDFSKVKVVKDEEKKTVTVTLPEPVIQIVSVNEGSLDFMFRDNSYNNESVFRDALSICKINLEAKIKQEKDFYKMVRDNAISTVNGLTRPYMDTVAPDYELRVEGGYHEKTN